MFLEFSWNSNNKRWNTCTKHELPKLVLSWDIFHETKWHGIKFFFNLPSAVRRILTRPICVCATDLQCVLICLWPCALNHKSVWWRYAIRSKKSTRNDWCCFYDSVRNSLVALLETQCAQLKCVNKSDTSNRTVSTEKQKHNTSNQKEVMVSMKNRSNGKLKSMSCINSKQTKNIVVARMASNSPLRLHHPAP